MEPGPSGTSSQFRCTRDAKGFQRVMVRSGRAVTIAKLNLPRTLPRKPSLGASERRRTPCGRLADSVTSPPRHPNFLRTSKATGPSALDVHLIYRILRSVWSGLMLQFRNRAKPVAFTFRRGGPDGERVWAGERCRPDRRGSPRTRWRVGRRCAPIRGMHRGNRVHRAATPSPILRFGDMETDVALGAIGCRPGDPSTLMSPHHMQQ